jgi:hypothetical protein
VSPNWTTASGAATLFTDFPGAQVRILGARAQVVPIIGQVSSTELSVAAWTNGTPLVGDAYEIYMVDMLTAANTNYNGTWFGEAGTIYRPDTAATTVATTGYDGYYLTSGAPGANDVSGDPGFVDATRRLSTWDTSLGGLGTAANAIAELIKLNDDAGYNTSYTVANAIAYVQAGFQPTNTAYKAGSTGGWIGAVDGPTPVSTTRAAVVESRGAMATGRGALADARQGLLQLRIGLAEARQSIVQGRAALIEARGTATTPVSQTVIAIAESRGAIVQTRTALVETNAGLAIVRTSANEARGRAVMTITPLIEARQSLVQARAAAVESTRGLSQARVSLLEARGYVAVVRVSLTEARSTPRLTSNVITVEAWFAVTTERTVEF